MEKKKILVLMKVACVRNDMLTMGGCININKPKQAMLSLDFVDHVFWDQSVKLLFTFVKETPIESMGGNIYLGGQKE